MKSVTLRHYFSSKAKLCKFWWRSVVLLESAIGYNLVSVLSCDIFDKNVLFGLVENLINVNQTFVSVLGSAAAAAKFLCLLLLTFLAQIARFFQYRYSALRWESCSLPGKLQMCFHFLFHLKQQFNGELFYLLLHIPS